MAVIEVIARYKKVDIDPFDPDFDRRRNFGSIRGTVDDSISQEELERHAREATPKGYEFIEVVREE